MKKMTKRFLSMLMSLTMVATMLPAFAISNPVTAKAANGDTLFHYTFDNANFSGTSATDISGVNNDSNGGNGLSVYEDFSWDVGDHYKSETDRYWFKDAWMRGPVSSAIGTSDANENWKIEFQFKYNRLNTLSNSAYTLGLASTNTTTAFFGIANNGNLVYDGTALVSSVCSFTANTTYTMTYEYNNSTFKVYLDGIKMCEYTPNATQQSVLEGINYIAIGGSDDIGTGMDCYDLLATESRVTFDAVSFLTDAHSVTDDGLAEANATKTGTVNWSDGAQFDGTNKIKIDLSSLSSVTTSTGMTLSMDVKHTNHSNNAPAISLSNSDSSNLLQIVGDWGDSVYGEYRLYAVNGSKNSTIYLADTNDSANANYYIGSCASSSWAWDYYRYHKDDWYNITYRFLPSEGVALYIDGVYYCTFSNAYLAAKGTGSLTSNDILNMANSLTTLTIGEGFQGYVKNVCLVSQDVNQTLPSSATMDQALAYAEAKMFGYQYKNQEAVYKAYFNACEAVDAIQYGNDSAKFNSARTALITAVNNMTAWTETEYVGNTYGTLDPKVYSADSRAGTGNYNKLAWCETGVNSSSSTESTTSGVDYYWDGYLTYPNVTMIYDGSTDSSKKPFSTILLTASGKKGKKRFVVGANTTNATTGTNGIALRDKWQGKSNGDGSTTDDVNWLLEQGYNTGRNSSEKPSAENCVAYTSGTSSRTIRFANRYEYSGSMDVNTAYAAITPVVHVYMNSSNSWTDSDPVSRDITGTKVIHVVNYKRVADTIKDSSTTAKVATASHLSDYKEGNADGVFENFDALTSWNSTKINGYFTSSNNWDGLQSDITSDLAGMNTAAATADTRTAYYQDLRDTLNNQSRTIGGDTYTLLEAYQGGADSIGFRNYAAFKTAFENVKTMFANLDNNDNASGYAQNEIGNSSTSGSLVYLKEQLIAAFNNLEIVNLHAPVITADGEYLDKTHGVTIANEDIGNVENASTVYETATSTDGGTTWGAWSASTAYSTKLVPFENAADNATNLAVKYRARSTDGTDYSGYSGETVVYYLSRPNITNNVTSRALANNDELSATQTLTIASSKSANGTAAGTLKYAYSLDGTTWSTEKTYSSAITPFADSSVSIGGNTVDLSAKTKVYIKAWEECGTSSSESYAQSYLILRNQSALDVYFKDDTTNETSTSTYDEGGHFYIDTANYTGERIYYTATVDGEIYKLNGNTVYFNYNINEGIDSDLVANHPNYPQATIVTLKFYVIEDDTKTVFAEGNFFKNNYDTLIYHETFNGSVSGSTYTADASEGKGVNLNLGSDGSVVSAAGDRNGTVAWWGKGKGSGDGTGDGSTQDWRHNVLKINANTSAETYVEWDSNPFATYANKAKLKAGGATISFWRANEYSSKAVQKSIGFKTSSETADYSRNEKGQRWKNAIAFRQGGKNTTADKYYMVEMTGVNSFMTTGGTDFIDADPYNQDGTYTSASSVSGFWEHVAITINPNAATLNEAITVYLNGVPHTTTVSPNGIYNSGTVKSDVDALIDFITDSNTYICYGHDNTWDAAEHENNTYFDDIRVYAKALTQKEIWESYYDENSDTPTIEGKRYSVTHDPTNVTVYKLTEAVSGVAAGSLVGQEFIDYHNLTTSQYTVDSYYSFGTGMTIYKSSDNQNWDIIGDSQGRVGYQNQDLFGSEYHTALSEALNQISTLMPNTPAAGNLVWAPHVMYNLSTNKWMMYVAISCWGDCKSTIIAMESSDGTLEHFKARDGGSRAYSFVVKSTGRPNAIDACPFYAHDSNGAILPDTLYMTYGAWSYGEEKTEDIAIMQLNSTGMYNSGNGDASGGTTSYENCYEAERGTRIASSLPSDNDSTGEGSFVVYNNGYYYLYVSYGHNDNEYNIRVFRSQNPTGPYQDMGGTLATDTEQSIHGTSFMRPYYNADCDYIYMSTGHNSIYNVINNYGEVVTLNATHARPMSNDDNGWKATPDAAMATRQVELSGNVTFVNPVYYTKNGWPVPMPLMYDGTDTTEYKGTKNKPNGKTFTASDIEGYYDGNIVDSYDGDYALHHTFNIVATDVDEGTIIDNNTSKGYSFKLEYGKNNGKDITYIILYNSSNTEVAQGVIANQASTGKPEFSIVHTDGRHTWGVWDKVYPRDVVNPDGEVNVELDGVVYTHKADDDYSKYGQEISDDETYLTTGSDERVTTIKIEAPYYIDTTDPNAIVCLNDAEFVAQGYTAGKYSVEFIRAFNKDGVRYDNEADYMEHRALTDEGGYIEYKLTGTVSDYFAYRNGKYQETGLELLIQYTDGTNKYGEYKFPYVTYNPAWAHTLAATRNTNSDTIPFGNKRQSSYGVFNRFENSYGTATDISSPTLRFASTGNTNETGWGTGVSGYVSNFASHSFGDGDLDTLEEIRTLFNFYDNTSVGVNSGSFAAWSHNDTAPNSYTATPEMINTQYYIDYSDTKNYLVNNSNGLITTENGVPTGYQFKMKTSNFLWANYSGASIFNTSSYAKNTTGLTVTYSSSYEDEINSSATENTAHLVYYDRDEAQGDMNKSGVTQTNFDKWRTSAGTGGKRTWYEGEMLFHTDERNDSNAIFGYGYRNIFLKHFTDKTTKTTQAIYEPSKEWDDGYVDGSTDINNPPSFYDYRDMGAYRTASNGKASTNAWQGTATFSGKNNLDQNTTATLQALADADANDSITYSNGRLYDGYYYYKKTKNQDNREEWTDDATYAANNTTSKGYGQLDVTAEHLANYILEMGNYHKITDIGVNGGRFLGSETYHYYNIGVATCDKGAVRELVDTWANNKMNISRDGKGKITTITGTGTAGAVEALNASDYSVASYNEYLKAVAEAYWFVNNPKNTTYVSSEDGETYNYSTAYNTFGGAKHAAIYTEDVGSNIFGDANQAAAADTYTEDGKSHTDEVQAQLIDNVIDAYENLFNITDYTGAEDIYGAITFKDENNETLNKSTVTVDDVKEIDITSGGNTVTYAYNGYTEDSWTKFVTLIKNVSEDFDYYTQDNEEEAGYDKKPTDIDYWRYTPITGKEYNELLEILTHANNSLMPKLDVTKLDELIDEKEDDRDAGIYQGTSGAQSHTFSSWMKLNSRIDTATALKTPSNDEDAKYRDQGASEDTYFEVGKYDVKEVKEYDFNGEKFYAQVFDSTPFNYANYETTGKPSAAQSAIYDELNVSDGGVIKAGNNHKVLGGISLETLDTDDAYNNYDSAYTVISSSINYDKYTDDAAALIAAELAKRVSAYNAEGNTSVYVTPTADAVSAYNTATGASITTSTEIRNLTTSEVDPYTTGLLTKVNTIDDVANNYVKHFSGTVQVTDVDGTPLTGYETPVALTNAARDNSTTFYYGDTYTVNIPEEAQGKCVISVTYTDPYQDGTPTVGSQKVSYNGSSFTKNAINNMTVTIKMTEKSKLDDYYKVQLENMYGAVVETIYVTKANLDTLLATANWDTNTELDFTAINGSDTHTRSATPVPFYTFSKWTVSKNDSEQTATFKPNYNVGDTVSLSVNGADSVSGAAYDSSKKVYKAAFDNYVTITKDGAYGWAAVTNADGTASGKYQIAAYGDTLNLYAVTEETFYPIIKDGSDYYVNSVKLTASNVDVKFTVDGITTDALLKQKLDSRKPFISLVAVDSVTNGNSKLSSGTAYCRVTTGASSYSEIGTLATTSATNNTDANMVKPTVQVFKTSTVLTTGQYSYTISSSGTGFARISFRGYIAYDLTYSYTDDSSVEHSADLNVSEYSSNIITKTPKTPSV